MVDSKENDKFDLGVKEFISRLYFSLPAFIHFFATTILITCLLEIVLILQLEDAF